MAGPHNNEMQLTKAAPLLEWARLSQLISVLSGPTSEDKESQGGVGAS
jgi:hypothetical protein